MPRPNRRVTVRGLYDIVFAFAVAIFIVVEGLIIWSVLRYRRKATTTFRPDPRQQHGRDHLDTHPDGHRPVPVRDLVADPQHRGLHERANGQKPDIQIRALAGQFQWQFEYLDANGNHVATQTKALGEGGGMAVPVGKKVYVTLRSGDVIHAWYVPRFLFKRDVVPGQENHFEFTVDPAEVGQTFHGQCAELCGANHRSMLFEVIALPSQRLRHLAEQADREVERDPSARAERYRPERDGPERAVRHERSEVPADAPFAIAFTNKDPAGITHDIDIRDSSGTVVASQDTIAGRSANYSYEPLPAGTYTFFCSIHSNMTGTLTVK